MDCSDWQVPSDDNDDVDDGKQWPLVGDTAIQSWYKAAVGTKNEVEKLVWK